MLYAAGDTIFKAYPKTSGPNDFPTLNAVYPKLFAIDLQSLSNNKALNSDILGICLVSTPSSSNILLNSLNSNPDPVLISYGINPASAFY